MKEPAEITVASEGPIVVATVVGEIDVYNAASVGTQLQEAVEPDAHGLVIDLSGVEFLDSTAILQLFNVRSALADRRQDMRVVVSDGGIAQRTLGLVDFDRAAPVDTSLQAALDALG